jgi:uncharacterized protein (DUF952 family)
VTGAEVTYHLAAEAYYRSCDTSAPYVPERFERDGFIHCTDGIEELIRVGNRYYRDDPRRLVILRIDKRRVGPPLRYDDPAHKYPHIYGPLNRDAIMDVHDAARLPRGAFVMPIWEPDGASTS